MTPELARAARAVAAETALYTLVSATRTLPQLKVGDETTIGRYRVRRIGRAQFSAYDPVESRLSWGSMDDVLLALQHAVTFDRLPQGQREVRWA